ncbi:MAG: amino acid ABC transporter permease [Ardenticatenia bacterium]|nr:MAG: amino acid ABC transporter permease [Ardenticatenia bacterium]
MSQLDLDPRSGAGSLAESIQRIPLWLVLLLVLGLGAVILVASSENYSDIASFISRGIKFTIILSMLGYALALVLGLIIGLGRLSTNPIIYALSTLYVEVFRGVPILVVIFYVAFVVSPKVGLRSDMTRAIVALGLVYGAYLAEVYRAGIQAIPKGQREAAAALGLSGVQTMRYIILPQAMRIILPPLGNDFIAILKDSSLASVLGVVELTHMTRRYVSRTFDTFGGWTIAALLYLSMTLILSMAVRALEHYSEPTGQHQK